MTLEKYFIDMERRQIGSKAHDGRRNLSTAGVGMRNYCHDDKTDYSETNFGLKVLKPLKLPRGEYTEQYFNQERPD